MNSEVSSVQNQLNEAREPCSDGGVGNALIHHSTIAESDHPHASYVDTRSTHRSRVASHGTGPVNDGYVHWLVVRPSIIYGMH